MTDWNHPGFDLPVLAEATGPFCRRPFLETVAEFDEGELLLAASDAALLPLRRIDDTIYFAGDPDYTDYHSPLGNGADALIADLASSGSARRFVLDSLPEEAAKPLAAGLAEAGWSVEVDEHEVAAVLHLPESFDDYLTAIGKKERHEVRRKRRRFERLVGEVRHETYRGPGWAFDEFVRLHRLAPGDKGDFMTEERCRLFASLAELDGWRFDLLRTPDDTAAAIVFGYSNDVGYFLYNSAFDPALGDASPGVVLLGTMIEQAIEEDHPTFDFLKGDEHYKFRLGAQPRPLLRVIAERGG